MADFIPCLRMQISKLHQSLYRYSSVDTCFFFTKLSKDYSIKNTVIFFITLFSLAFGEVKKNTWKATAILYYVASKLMT